MIVWHDKEGKSVGFKEFFQRWGKGIEGVTPMQQTKSQLFFSIMMLIGILCGVLISIYNWKTLWWLGIVLIAAFGNTCISTIGIYQKYRILKKVFEELQGVEIK